MGQSLLLRGVIPFTPSERYLVGPWIRVQVTNEMRGEGESSYTSCFIGGQNRKWHLNEIWWCRLKPKYKGWYFEWIITMLVFNLFKYLKDPAQPILEALEKDSSPKDDAWDSVSIVSFPGKEWGDGLPSTLLQSTGPVCQAVGRGRGAKELLIFLSGLFGAQDAYSHSKTGRRCLGRSSGSPDKLLCCCFLSFGVF